ETSVIPLIKNVLMPKSVLLTAAIEDSESFRNQIDRQKIKLLHYPLERYQHMEDDESVLNVFGQLQEFENITYGSKRNARFFVEKMNELGKQEVVRQRLNLALDKQTADYLETEDIPAIHPQANGKAINVLEFMLRT